MLSETPVLQVAEPGEPSLYVEFRENPEAFIDALVRQMEMEIATRLKHPLTEKDLKEMKDTARKMCCTGFWRFAGGLLFLVECCVTNYVSNKMLTE